MESATHGAGPAWGTGPLPMISALALVIFQGQIYPDLESEGDPLNPGCQGKYLLCPPPLGIPDCMCSYTCLSL